MQFLLFYLSNCISKEFFISVLFFSTSFTTIVFYFQLFYFSDTLEAISKHERNKKIREGHREIAEAMKQDAAILIRRSEFTSASDVLAKLGSISKTLKKKQECLAALDDKILQKCGRESVFMAGSSAHVWTNEKNLLKNRIEIVL